MSEENKDGKTVRDLKPDKDPKGGFGPEPPEGGGSIKGNPPDKGSTKGSPGPNPLPPIGGANN